MPCSHRVCLVLGVGLLGFTASAEAAPRISPQAPAPDWALLQPYAETITEKAFSDVVNNVYAPGKAFWKYGRTRDGELMLFSTTSKKGDPIFRMKFAPDDAQERSRPGFFYPEAPRMEVVKAKQAAAASEGAAVPPLLGVKVCIDPGHLGGKWAELEKRHFKIEDDNPVVEGELTLITAELIAAQLRKLGASVLLTRRGLEPVTTKRPEAMLDDAVEALTIWRRRPYTLPATEAGRKKFQEIANKLFFIHAEIRAREALVDAWQPDLTLCIHYNASDWGKPGEPKMTPVSRLVIFVNGAYSSGELSYDDQKFEMMLDVLDQVYPLELAAADRIARQMARTFDLAPETYKGWKAVKQVGPNPYVFARNLLANRVFGGPVVFIEGPYMNAQDYYKRLEAGDYEGLREIDGKQVRSVLRDMADAILRGTLEYFEVPREQWPAEVVKTQSPLSFPPPAALPKP